MGLVRPRQCSISRPDSRDTLGPNGKEVRQGTRIARLRRWTGDRSLTHPAQGHREASLKLCIWLLAASCCGIATTPTLQVSANGRFLRTSHGKPFFWLGDTAWLLFQNLT